MNLNAYDIVYVVMKYKINAESLNTMRWSNQNKMIIFG